jgi:uncharacterized protein (TIGR02145 family)
MKIKFGTFTDKRDGRTYKTVKIGKQVWLAENLAYKSDGSLCYNNNSSNDEIYGRLYNWEMAKKACPPGWHLPRNDEWDMLVRYVDGNKSTESPYDSKTAGKLLKAKSGWNNNGECEYRHLKTKLKAESGLNNNGNGEDKFGFAALPGGYGRTDSYPSYVTHDFDYAGRYGFWWSASEYNTLTAYYKSLSYDNDNLLWILYDKRFFHSVRCVKDGAK